MSRRFRKGKPISPYLYAPGSPVVVVTGGVVLDTKRKMLFGQLKLRNISKAAISSLKLVLRTKDAKGNVLDEAFRHQLDGVEIKPDTVYVDRKGIPLDKAVRAFDVSVAEVTFSDGTSVDLSAAEFKSLAFPKTLEKVYGKELAAQYKRDIGKKAKYNPFEYADLWCCSCGKYNHDYDKKCRVCGAVKEKQMSNADKEILQANLEEFKRQEEIRIAEEKRKAEELRLKNEAEYATAAALAESEVEEELQQALAIFKKLGSFNNSNVRAVEVERKIKSLQFHQKIAFIEKRVLKVTDKISEKVNWIITAAIALFAIVRMFSYTGGVVSLVVTLFAAAISAPPAEKYFFKNKKPSENKMYRLLIAVWIVLIEMTLM